MVEKRSKVIVGRCGLSINFEENVVVRSCLSGHGNKFERISSNFNFEWTKFEFFKNRNKFESLCSNFQRSTKRASDFSPFHLVPRGPLGPLMFLSC